MDFSSSQMWYSSCRKADVSWCNFSNTNLEGVDFQEANLFHAKLTNAMLWGADFENAWLTYAELENATMWAAKLQGAAGLHKLMRAHAYGYAALTIPTHNKLFRRPAALRRARLRAGG